MKIVLLYLRILERVEPSLPVFVPYEWAEARFLASYKAFRPTQDHELLVVNCSKAPDLRAWDGVVTRYASYCGFGSDCGTFQSVGSTLDSDLVVCFNTIAYLWTPNWLDPFIQAREQFGPGVYGPTGSYEQNPHLRTPCIAFSPEVIRKYPILIDTREKAGWFEHGPNNFSLWAHRSGIPARMVTTGGSYSLQHWRHPENIFRRGDQSNCLVRDRHTDIYDASPPGVREQLARSANGRR